MKEECGIIKLAREHDILINNVFPTSELPLDFRLDVMKMMVQRVYDDGSSATRYGNRYFHEELQRLVCLYEKAIDPDSYDSYLPFIKYGLRLAERATKYSFKEYLNG